MNNRVALAIVAILVLVIHGFVFYQQFFNKWERHQTAYFEQALSLAKSDTERAAIEKTKPRIEQIIVTQFGDSHVDRCTTCHIASDDPRFQKYGQPLRTHPYSVELGDTQTPDGRWERRHKFSDFGCTVCHDGQGRGLEALYAHGEDPYWPDPLLGYVTQPDWHSEFRPKLLDKQYMQANCAQCHTEEGFKGTLLVARGRQLFFEKACYGCHRIEGLSDGTLGPDLSEAGKKYKINYLWEHTVNPRAFSAQSFMPKFDLTDDEIKALVIFLKSRRGLNFAETSMEQYRARLHETKAAPGATSPAELPSVARGQQLVAQRSCTACHKLGDKDGHIAPDLSFEGLIRADDWILAHFNNPRSRVPDSIMPSFGFPEPDFQALTSYLVSLKTAPTFNSGEEIYKGICARCHGEKGDGKGVTHIYLDPAPRDLTKVGFMNSKPLDRFLNSIAHGVPGTSMPSLERVLTETQRRQVLDYVFVAFVKEPRKEIKEHKIPDQNSVAMSEDSINRGEKIFMERCTGCHGRKQDGKGPNSLDISPRPRNLRNYAFIQSVSDRRLMDSILYGVQGTAMPSWIDYGLTQKDAGDLINFIRSLNRSSRPTAPADKTASLTQP